MFEIFSRLPQFLLPDALRAVDYGLQSQEQIRALPTILGVLQPPEDDLTERVDQNGRVYRWELSPDGPGFWAQAGYVRGHRQRFGQVIDANDIKWFDLKTYHKSVSSAARRVGSVTAAREQERRKSGTPDTMAEDVIPQPEPRMSAMQERREPRDADRI